MNFMEYKFTEKKQVKNYYYVGHCKLGKIINQLQLVISQCYENRKYKITTLLYYQTSFILYI